MLAFDTMSDSQDQDGLASYVSLLYVAESVW